MTQAIQNQITVIEVIPSELNNVLTVSQTAVERQSILMSVSKKNVSQSPLL